MHLAHNLDNGSNQALLEGGDSWTEINIGSGRVSVSWDTLEESTMS